MKAEQDIHDQVRIGRESTEVADDITNHRGTRMEFLTMNSIDTWKNPMLMRTTTQYAERFQRMSSSSDDIEKRDGEQKGIQRSRLTTTQNVWIGKIDEKYRTSNNS